MSSGTENRAKDYLVQGYSARTMHECRTGLGRHSLFGFWFQVKKNKVAVHLFSTHLNVETDQCPAAVFECTVSPVSVAGSCKMSAERRLWLS